MVLSTRSSSDLKPRVSMDDGCSKVRGRSTGGRSKPASWCTVRSANLPALARLQELGLQDGEKCEELTT